MMAPIFVAEFRSVFHHTVGGPDKTILVSAAQHDPARVRIVPFFLVPVGDGVPALRDLARRTGIEPILIPDRARFDPFVVPLMRDRLRRHGCRILHTHDFKTDFLGPLIAGGDVRLMATAHGWSRPMSLKHRFYNAIDRRVLRRFPAVVAVSEATAEVLRRSGVPRERLAVLANGVDTDLWRPRAAEGDRPAGLPRDGRLIGMAARLSPDKDLETLLAAFERVAASRPDVRLVIAGDGPERTRLERQAAASPAAARIHFLGRREDLPAFMGWLSVVVLSSRAEGMPNSLLEALACGRPTVATRVGGVGEIARDGEEALLVPPGDVTALAGSLGRLLDDPRLAGALGEAGRRRIEGGFSFSGRLRRLEAIYAAVVAGRPIGGMNPAK
jgi:glycosyltransferase involved in cell wall biosynthesis